MKTLIKKTFSIAMFTLTTTLTFAQKPTDDFSGKWKTTEGKIITISKTGTSFIGKAEDNKTIVLNQVKFSEKKWSAIISNPKENKTANCELILEGENLKIIAKKGIMSKTIIWTKTK
jgi:hypothetical protein